jgi:hypothetical protein
MNAAEKRIVSARDWDFLDRQYTKTTVASQRAYQLPAYTRKPQSVYITVSSQRYTPVEVTSRQEWDRLNQTTVTSDTVTHYFVYDGQIEFFPVPASTGNTITFNSRRVAKDLSMADYTTGTITTVSTTGVTTTVTGSSTVWTTAMQGRYIQFTPSDLALTLSGDGFWYEIATVASNTSLTLVKPYGGTAIAAATASYTIGEASLLPEPHDMLPIYDALKYYYTSIAPDSTKASEYAIAYKEGYTAMLNDQGSKVNVVLEDIDSNSSPNLYVTL